MYFPEDALVSAVAVAHGGKGLEVGMIGYQGLSGSSLALGISSSPARLLVRSRGKAYRVKARALTREMERSTALRRGVQRIAYVDHVIAAQVAACNGSHSLNQRCARWLLTTSDHLRSPSFFLTQAFLAQMLGVRRAGVNEVATDLQRRRLVTYRRGHLAILDRPGLLAASCGCYALIQGATKAGSAAADSPRSRRGAARLRDA